MRWRSPEHVVSASTDGTLRLWSLSSGGCERVYTGHLNERNFVGLSTTPEFIACGSERNEVHVYYQGMSRTVARYSFAANGSASPADGAAAADAHDADAK